MHTVLLGIFPVHCQSYHRFYETGDQRSAQRHTRNVDVLVCGVGAATHRSQPIQYGDT